MGNMGDFNSVSLYFFTNFCRSGEFFANLLENSRGVGVSTVFVISAAIGVTVVACCC